MAPSDRQCERCRGTIPFRTHRQRDDKGLMVCEECAKMKTPDWPVVSSLTPGQQREFQKRAAEALRSITRTAESTENPSLTCPRCKGEGDVHNGVECDLCKGTGYVDSKTLHEDPHYASSEKRCEHSGCGKVAEWIVNSRTLGDWKRYLCEEHKDDHKDVGTSPRHLVASLSTARTAGPPGASAASMRYLLSLSRQHSVPEGDASTAITLSDVDEILNHDGAKRGVRVTQRAVSKAIDVLKGTRTASRKEAHDSGDNALIHHCPFCGSGAVTGGSDGSVDCDYCHSVFTVQVQPAHPNMPQTIDGQPLPPPGMPAGQETELSAPVDPAVDEDPTGAPADALGDAEASPAEQSGQATPDEDNNPVPPQFRKGSKFFTTDGEVLDLDRYVRRLALDHADDRLSVLAKVRQEND